MQRPTSSSTSSHSIPKLKAMQDDGWKRIWQHEFSKHEYFLVKHDPDMGVGCNISGNISEEDNNYCSLSVLIPHFHQLIRSTESYPIYPYQTYRLPFYKKNEHLFITSCRGLVCLDNHEGRLVICNFNMQCLKALPLPHRRNLNHTHLDYVNLMPSDRVQRYGPRLPSFRQFVATGFGIDYATNDYKVVRIISYTYQYRPPGDYVSYEVEEKIVVEVYSLRDECWREIEFPSFVAEEAISYDYSVHLAGIYYWCIGFFTRRLLCFNFSTEEFFILDLPEPDSDLSPNHLYCVLELEGLLVAVGYDPHRKPPNDLFVFWGRDGDTWSLMMKFAVDKGLRPLFLKPNIFFFERKVVNQENLSEIVVVHVFSMEKVYAKRLGYIDRQKFLMLVSYGKSTYCPPNAEHMTGSYTIEEASDEDEDPDNFISDEQ